ncbi:MAG: BON domain-containing protein, partial [Sterolibacterium sp.]|nr:BON domain-containing protein [Sterolibacterium sp.]MBP9800878.1 BON domain-containing protein [Sterolibacterium sp.]
MRHLLPALLSATLLLGPILPVWADETIEPVTPAEMTEIRATFRNVGLNQANLETGSDGRITLTGEYENREEVETAFAAARAVVGLRRVAPTTPNNIKYRLKGFQGAFSSTIARMMQKPKPAPATTSAAPATAAPAAPPRRTGPQSFALIVGVNKFRNLPESKHLEGAGQDAQGLYNLLTAPGNGNIPADNARLLTGEQATSKAVK